MNVSQYSVEITEMISYALGKNFVKVTFLLKKTSSLTKYFRRVKYGHSVKIFTRNLLPHFFGKYFVKTTIILIELF